MAGAYLSSLVSIALMLLLVGVSAFLLINAKSVSDYFKESLEISVLMKQEVQQTKADEYSALVSELPFVHSASVVSREQGTEEMKALLGDDFLQVFEASPVPISVSVRLTPEYVCADSLDSVISALADYPVVDEVDCQTSLVDALNSNIAKISMVLGILILLLLFISFVLITNTVRLNAFNKRFSVYTMQLVGATRPFIRRPFILSGILQGFLSAVLALAVLGCCGYMLYRSFPALMAIVSISQLLLVAGIVIAAGVVICMLSTWVVMNRILSMSKDELYG